MASTLLSLMLLLAGGPVCTPIAGDLPSPVPTISYCELQSNPELFLNKPVRLRAIYVFGFEWQEFDSAQCQAKHRIWVEIADSVENRSTFQGKRWLRSADDAGTFGLVVRGRLTGSNGGFGHLNAYDCLFVIDCVESAELLDNDGRAPSALPPRALDRARAFERGLAGTTPN